jgi:CDP-4-dehydro-6-deoxyglucose reductase, E1
VSGRQDGDDLRAEILAQVRRYADQVCTPPPFEPGVSRVSYAGRVFDAEEMVQLVDSALEFWLSYGRFSLQFEAELASFLGVKHCLFVNSGSSANLLAFTALTSDRLGERRVKRGDEVITVACGFPTTVAPMVQFGAVPVFVDVEPATANIAVDQLDAALSPRTRAVFLAHTLGNPFDVAAVLGFCRRHDLWLIEDNCDSLGARYQGRLTGGFGHIGTSSFYPAHQMTTGEGGAVYTDDDELHAILLSLRDWGRDCVCPSGVDDSCGRRFAGDFGTLPHGYDHKYVYSHFGFNLKATDLQAAIGCAQLGKLPGFVAARQRNFATLARLLAPLGEDVLLPQATAHSEPSWFGCLLTLRDSGGESAGSRSPGARRDSVVAHLERANVQTRMLFAGNITRQPCFDALRVAGSGYRVVGDLAVSDAIMTSSFWVGVYPGLTEEMLAYVAAQITEAVGAA